MPFAAALVFGGACSDYDLQEERKTADGRRDDDSGAPDRDDTGATDSGEGDSGGDTLPDESDTDPPEDLPDGKVDVVLLVDIAYFYDCYHADLAVRTNEVVTALLGSGVDVSVSIATFDDYQVADEWWAAWGGLPYALEQQMTNDLSRLQAVAGRLELGWGGDGPGSGYEAIVQATGGLGYDQDCDGNVDADTDVKPYKALSSDAFGGNAGSARDGSVPGTGSEGGVGFREGSKRVVVMLTENAIRDRSEGDSLPTGACLGVASKSDAKSGIQAVDAKFLGVNAYEFQDKDQTLQEQLEELASSTGSKIDADGDGAKDDVAVLYGSWDWPDTSLIVAAIWDLAGA